jgi:hypothetical protein
MKIFYEDKELEGERLELTDNKEGHYYLGPNLTLRRCAVVLRARSAWLHIQDTRFIDCDIEVRQELKNYQDWVHVSLRGCRFKGRLAGCDFGHWPHFADGWEHGTIEDCDFTEARLDSCRFHGCDPSTLRLPRWPCFSLLEPIRRSRDWALLQWPGDIGPVIINHLASQPPSTVTVTYFAPALAKRSGTTPEAIKAVLEKADGVFY